MLGMPDGALQAGPEGGQDDGSSHEAGRLEPLFAFADASVRTARVLGPCNIQHRVRVMAPERLKDFCR
jgi:hypothetical protein